ncbi:hypothetical protein VNO80_05614 [Phaseolus coccineus]|uniref:NB-ARC domain-containing protein n=1 Tax=Phaseolus coccineus TaxID=3886 RepID=A0AAN9NFD2_PHACN
MEDFFFSIATKIAEYAIVPILDHAQYLCCFHNFALNLSNNKEQLELTRDSVKKKIREATNRIEKVEPTVEKWLKDIEKVLDEVRMLEERILKVNKSYLRRQCQYSLAKEIERKTTKMIQLNRDSKFEPFSTTIELPGMEYYSSNDFFMFKSTEASYNKLLEILKNKSIPFDESYKACCILITTRSKEVCTSMQCQSIIELNLLSDKEAWTLFTHYAKITDVSSEALKGVARKIINECKGLPIAIVTVGSTLKGKTVEDFELALSRLENSKPLNIPKGLISPYACLELSYNNLNNQLAQSLLLLCSMFPEDYEIDLEDLFRFGRGFGTVRTFGTMENARREMHEAIDILKSCFLLMQAGRKENVKLHDLVRDVALWIASKSGQAIFTGTEMDPSVLADDEIMKDKQAIALWNNGTEYGFVDYRINCPTLEILLLYSKGGIKVSDMGPQSWEKIKTLAIKSLNEYRKDLSLPESLKSLKNLRTLCLRNHDLGDISFVERLQALEILDLRDSSFENIPVGIVELKKLKILDLYRCWIKKKNVEAYKVVGRCLQLEELYFYLINLVQYFPHDVSFSRLQRLDSLCSLREVFCDPSSRCFLENLGELFINDCSKLNNISLLRKSKLCNLKVLSISECPLLTSLFEPSIVQSLVLLEKLIISSCSGLSGLKYVFGSEKEHNIAVYPSFQQTDTKNLSNLGTLRLMNLPNVIDIWPEYCRPHLPNLKDLDCSACPKLLDSSIFEMVTSSNLQQNKTSMENETARLITNTFDQLNSLLFPLQLEELKLSDRRVKGLFQFQMEEEEGRGELVPLTLDITRLYLRNLPELNFIWKGPTGFLSLQKLQSVIVDGCPKLKTIFSITVVTTLPVLEGLDIHDCDELEQIFDLGDAQQLKTLYSSQQLCYPTLSSIEVKKCNKLNNLPGLNFIWKGPTGFLSLQKLRHVNVNGCPKLKTIFSITVVTSLPKLEFLYIYNCDELEQIFDLGDAQQLQTLYSSQQLCFPTLSSIDVTKCNKLKCLFYNLSASPFTSLKYLKIEECSQLHKAFGFEHEADDGGEEETAKKEEQVLQKLTGIALKNLPNFEEIHYGFKLKEDVYHIMEECPKYSPSLYLHPGKIHISFF